MRTFGNITAPPKEPQPFQLQGHYTDGTEGHWTATFTVLADPPAGALDRFTNSIAVVDGKQTFDKVSLCGFVRECLVPADEQAWDELMVDKRRAVPLADVAELAGWIAAMVTGRPTGA